MTAFYKTTGHYLLLLCSPRHKTSALIFPASHVCKVDDAPVSESSSYPLKLFADKRQDIPVDDISLGRWHPVWKSRVGNECAILEQGGGFHSCILIRYDLIIFTVQYQHRNVNRFQVFGKIGFGKCLDTFIMRKNAAHHALPPPVALHPFFDRGAFPVIAVKREGEVYEKLLPVGQGLKSDIIKNGDRHTTRIAVALHHYRRNSADQNGFRHPVLSIFVHIADHFSATARIPDMHS